MTGMSPEFSAAAVATALRAAGHRPTEWRAARQGGYAVLDLGDLGQPRIQVTLTDGPLAFLLPDGHGRGILAAYTAALTAAGYDATISDGGTSILITPLPGQRRPPAAAQRAHVTVTVTTASRPAPPRRLQHGRHAVPRAPATAAGRARMLGRRARQLPAPLARKAALMLLMLHHHGRSADLRARHRPDRGRAVHGNRHRRRPGLVRLPQEPGQEPAVRALAG